VLKLSASIEKGSEHSLAEAIVNKAEEQKLEIGSVTKFQAIAGHGVEGLINTKKVFLGNRKLMDKEKVDYKEITEQMSKLESDGKTVMMLALNGNLHGLIAVADTLKESAKDAVRALQSKGIEVVMITGDNERTAQAIASKVGIKRVLAEVLPDQKEAEIRKLQSQGKIVAMVGDGINDAPALVTANVGIAMGTGTDIAIDVADIILINKDLNTVASAIELSRKTMQTIKINLVWAFGYNIVLIPVAMGLLYPLYQVLLSPILAGGAMAFSSISVVGNSLLLKRARI
jgi:Cu+-exporting ATPase